MEKFILRTQLQVDASPMLKQQIKQLALTEGKSLKQFVLLALAKQYPSLDAYVKAELKTFDAEDSGQTRAQ